MDDAEYAFVGLGSMMETAQGAVDFLREKGMLIGVISVTSFRPFPGPEIAADLRNCTAAVVIERTDVPLAQSNPLLSEVKAALVDAAAAGEIEIIPELYGAVAGLGGNDIRPGHFVALARRVDEGGNLSILGIKHLDATASIDVLAQAPRDEPVQFGRRGGRDFAGRWRVFSLMAASVETRDSPRNARLPGGHLVEHRAEREDVAGTLAPTCLDFQYR
jgi:hypothetical protein